jgi:hypothetical protein
MMHQPDSIFWQNPYFWSCKAGFIDCLIRQNFCSVVPNATIFKQKCWISVRFLKVFRPGSIFWPFLTFFNEHKLECPDCGVHTCRTKDAKIRTYRSSDSQMICYQRYPEAISLDHHEVVFHKT